LGNLDAKALQAVFEVLQQHFPESLSELWFLNTPMLFYGLWKVVSPFIQPATKDKITFLSGRTRGAVLAENVSPQVVSPISAYMSNGGRNAVCRPPPPPFPLPP
jgi:hypothetical protein